MVDKITSPRFSFQNWEFGKWLRGHWKTIKEAAKILAPLWFSSVEGFPPAVTLIVTAGFVGLSSAIEYWVKEYKE